MEKVGISSEQIVSQPLKKKKIQRNKSSTIHWEYDLNMSGIETITTEAKSKYS
jgi:hypothetical protein